MFDELYPFPLRTMASIYWTPVAVAIQAARMLVGESSRRVLDVGSGAGKFCLVGALATPGQFVGVEQRGFLVDCAREGARLLETPNATFIHGVFDALDPAEYDAFYFFNPFAENKFAEHARFDQTVELTPERFDHDVRSARCFLRAAKRGAHVVTYNGLGGPLPSGYRKLKRVQMGCMIELWEKMR
jgi:SAM-dependent methyltransferase